MKFISSLLAVVVVASLASCGGGGADRKKWGNTGQDGRVYNPQTSRYEWSGDHTAGDTRPSPNHPDR